MYYIQLKTSRWSPVHTFAINAEGLSNSTREQFQIKPELESIFNHRANKEGLPPPTKLPGFPAYDNDGIESPTMRRLRIGKQNPATATNAIYGKPISEGNHFLPAAAAIPAVAPAVIEAATVLGAAALGAITGTEIGETIGDALDTGDDNQETPNMERGRNSRGRVNNTTNPNSTSGSSTSPPPPNNKGGKKPTDHSKKETHGRSSPPTSKLKQIEDNKAKIEQYKGDPSKAKEIDRLIQVNKNIQKTIDKDMSGVNHSMNKKGKGSY